MCFLMGSGQLHHSSGACFLHAPLPQPSPRDHSKPSAVLTRIRGKQTQLPTNDKTQSSLKSREILQLLQSLLCTGSHFLKIMSITDTSVMLLLTVAVESFTGEWAQGLNHSCPLGGRTSMGLSHTCSRNGGQEGTMRELSGP